MRPLLRLLSPPGPRARLSVLIFHRVVAQTDPLFPGEVCAARFDAICTWLRAWFAVLPLDEAARRLQDGTLPARAAAITFDDGYADNHDVALPILQRHGLSASFFIASGFLDGGCMWNDQVIDALRHCRHPTVDLGAVTGQAQPPVPLGTWDERRAAIATVLRAIKYLPPAERLARVGVLRRACAASELPTPMMSSAQLRAMHTAGMVIGAHTVHHPILARLPRHDASDEIRLGRESLQDILQAPVNLFAYPNGKPGEDYSPESVDIAREQGFAAAFTTSPGAARQDTDRFQLPRFTPWDTRRLRFGLQLATNLM
jgi:peptidoglycan/xylan/chitin deacetylase (PgdA/CDA1 family)